MSKRTPKLYLDDILTALGKIEQYTQGIAFEQFRADSKTVDAVVRNLEVIGEAARQLPKDFAADHPEIPGGEDSRIAQQGPPRVLWRRR